MNQDKNGRPVEILLVEDNPGDVRLTQEALKEAKVHNNLSVVGDGVEAMAFLRREGSYATAPRPDIVLLDLNLPKKDGREVLAEVAGRERAEQRARDRVQQHVTVGVAQQALVVRDLDAPEPERPPRCQTVGVEALSDASCHSRTSISAAARARSAAVVILKLPGSPSTT